MMSTATTSTNSTASTRISTTTYDGLDVVSRELAHYRFLDGLERVTGVHRVAALSLAGPLLALWFVARLPPNLLVVLVALAKPVVAATRAMISPGATRAQRTQWIVYFVLLAALGLLEQAVGLAWIRETFAFYFAWKLGLVVFLQSPALGTTTAVDSTPFGGPAGDLSPTASSSSPRRQGHIGAMSLYVHLIAPVVARVLG